MKILKILLLLSVAKNASPRRHRGRSLSGESIENLLYFQDCMKTTVPTTTTTFKPIKLHGDPPEPSCPFPKMCCAMSCNNEPCVSEQLNNYGKQIQPSIEPMNDMEDSPFTFRQAQAALRPRKRKMRPPKGFSPLNGRRDFGFTKERIKSLISNDDDIRKILKDLVRVTMEKVDLQEMINTRNAETQQNMATTDKPDDGDMIYDDDD